MRPESGPFVAAAFDLDGTLIDGHAIVDFAAAVAGRPGLALAAARALPHIGVPPRRTAFKEALFRRVLAGRDAVEVREVGEALARHIVGTRLRPSENEQLALHRAAGHELVMVTASLDAYVDPIAELLGFDAVIAVGVEVAAGRCTGALVDADLYDERKVERLRSWLGPREPDVVLFAYGNTENDGEMIRYAESTRRRAEAMAARSASDGPATRTEESPA